MNAGSHKLVGDSGYVNEQMSPDHSSSPVWGAVLNIHDNCYPRIVEPSGNRKKMVVT